MTVERGSDNPSASIARAKPERQKSKRREGISLDLSGDDSLFADDRISEKDEPIIKKRSSVERDLEATDRIIDKKAANARRQTISSASRPTLRRRATDEKSTRSDGYRRKQSISSLSVAKDLEAADRLIDRKKRSQSSQKRPTWQSGEAKSNEMLQKLSERKSLSRSAVTRSDRHEMHPIASGHVSNSKLDVNNESQGERAIALPRASSRKSSKDMNAFDKRIKSQGERINISSIVKCNKSQREIERNASNSECNELAPFVSPVERMRRRRSSELLSVPTKTENAESARERSCSLSSSGTNPQGANSNMSLKKSISSTTSGISNAASVSDFVPMKIRARSNDRNDANISAQLHKQDEIDVVRNAARSNLSLKRKSSGSKPDKTKDLVLGNPYRRDEVSKTDSQHARSSIRRSCKTFDNNKRLHTRRNVDGSTGKSQDQEKMPRRRSKSLDVRKSTSSKVAEGSPRNSHQQSGIEFTELSVHEKQMEKPRRRSRSASGDLRFSRSERNQPADENSSFSHRVDSTRHKFDMRETKHGRFRNIHRTQSERTRQNTNKEKMYKSKSDRSVGSSAFRVDDRREVTDNDVSSRRGSYDDIDESKNVYIYEMPIEDDPSMITDTASYDVRSRRSHRTYAKSVQSSGSSHHELAEVDEEECDEEEYGENGVYIEDEETEYYEEICHDVPRSRMSKIYAIGERKGIKRKHCCCLLTIFAVSALAIFAAVMFVVLPTITQTTGAAEVGEPSDSEGIKVNTQFSIDGDSPSAQPSIEEVAIAQSTQLKPAPSDIEGRCSPSNFPGASSVCEAACNAAKCCYAHLDEEANIQYFDLSADTPEGKANLLQCEGYKPYCDVLFNPWVQSFNGIIRPPADNLDQVCRNRLRLHADHSFGRKLVDNDNECLKACFPSKCCTALRTHDMSAEEFSLQADGTVIDMATGKYMLTSCRDNNEDACNKYDKYCDGVFARSDAMSLNPTRTPRATFPPASAAVPLPSSDGSNFSPFTPTFNVANDNQNIIPSQQSVPANGPRPNPSYDYPSHPSFSTPTFDSTSQGVAGTSPTIPSENNPTPSILNDDVYPSPSQISPNEPSYHSPTSSSLDTMYYPTPQSAPNKEELYGNTNSSASEIVSSTDDSPLVPTNNQNTSANSYLPSISSALVPIPSAPPNSLIPEAQTENIKASCSGDSNVDRIMHGENEACLRACRAGLCCFLEEFQAAGLASTAKNEEFFEDVESCYTSNELACYEYSSCLVMTLERKETVTTSPSPTMLIPPPTPVLPYANPGVIYSSCAGPENFQLITNQDIDQNERCLSACEKGLCCYIDLFAKRGITAIDEDGNAVEVESCWEGNEAICSGYEPCLVLTMAVKPSPPPVSPMTYRPVSEAPSSSSPTSALTSRIPTSKPTDPLSFQIPSNPDGGTIPLANTSAIADACTGAERTELISSGDKEAMEDCLLNCWEGACCFRDIFTTIGIHVIDEDGSQVDLPSCFEGNEKICGGYTGCLTLSLSYTRPKTLTPTITPPSKFVAEASIDEIDQACNDADLISSGNLQARDKCFDTCRNGVCCFAEVFTAIGIQVVDSEEGGKEPIKSCLSGNEKLCAGYSGCLVLTLAS